MEALLDDAGFAVERSRFDGFKLRFVDAEAMFEHYLIRYWFLPSWKELVDEADRESVFTEVEQRMNAAARAKGEVVLDVPFVTLDCRRR
jgi:hypothetical protein